MNVDFQKMRFVEPSDNISYQNEEQEKRIYFNMCLYSEKFREYQKNLLNDFYSKILDLLNKTESYSDFKKHAESEIKQFNTQLRIFEEKINSEEKIAIRGFMQIVWEGNYMSALIGDSSLIIFRHNKLESVIINEVEPDDKIDIFGEIIEGELENEDRILAVCTDIYNYMTDDEIKEVINFQDSSNALSEILTTRVEESEIGSIEQINIKIDKIRVERIKKLNFDKYTEIIRKNKYPIGIVIGLIIVFLLIFSMFSHVQNSPKKFVLPNGEQRTASIDDLKRKIDTFGKLEDVDTQAKKQTYEEIIAELNMYEKNNIQTLEIKELRKKVEQNYYKGFNINLVSKDDGILSNIYDIDENTFQSLSGVTDIFQSASKFDISGEKGILLGAINNQHKGIVQKINIPTKVKTCTTNLSENGLYCVMENDDIYNISKYGINALSNNEKKWPKNIVSIGTYGKNKIYVLTEDPELNAKGIYIIRYVLKSKDDFGVGTEYVFGSSVSDELKNSIYSGSTMSVDGTFVIWGKDGILQAFRESNSNNLLSLRKIEGREKAIIEDGVEFKGKVKVISNIGSNYIHAFDFNTNSLITYLTSPYKTNSTYSNSFKLIYKFKTKFDFNNEELKNIAVEYNSTTKDKNVLVLTDKSIYKLNLNQFEN